MYAPTLLETGRKAEKTFGTSALSTGIHAIVIVGAVALTWTTNSRHDAGRVDTTAVMLETPRSRPPEPPPPMLSVALKGFQTIAIPTVVATAIPPVDLQQHFDPKDFTGIGVEGGRADGIAPSADRVYPEALVQEAPILLAAPPPPYPDLLRRAGIEGRVLLQAIVDTTGRIEPGSMKILKSPSDAFDEPVKQWALKALFRPARFEGRAVRVLVRLPLDYAAGARGGL
jgi:periplasmic protein TonB